MQQTLLSRLADRLILRPTTHAIPVEGRRRHAIAVAGDEVEVWIHDVGLADRDIDLFVLKFPGTGGRAERATDQPVSFWPDLRGQIWSVNPPGYGGSSGRPSLIKAAPMARAVFDELHGHAGERPILVAANSLGGVSALHLAAVRPVSGLLLRNPPHLPGVIIGRFGWRSLYLGAWWIARQVPWELDAIANAGRATAPGVFVMAVQDTIVPAKYQRMIHQAYGGPHRVVLMHEADHATAMLDAEVAEYQRALGWLRSLLPLSNSQSPPPGPTEPCADSNLSRSSDTSAE